MVNDDMVEVQYRNTEEFAQQNGKVNVVIAAFTTAYARLKLYDLLYLLQERALYYDTDSVIYVHESGKPEPPLGNYLGDLTEITSRLLSPEGRKTMPTVQRKGRRTRKYGASR